MYPTSDNLSEVEAADRLAHILAKEGQVAFLFCGGGGWQMLNTLNPHCKLLGYEHSLEIAKTIPGRLSNKVKVTPTGNP